ncbi:MAG: hypothetical protein A2143_08115 [Gallionellales bacterium RBG_16_57_15]|nr:MAG: hypothetical protein A2143_08115 [Gallionellales bacterium RBG_16_57_15]
MIEQFHKQAILLALKKMMEGKHFNICTLDQAMEITGVRLNSKDSAALRALHCIDWADMSPELRRMVFAKIMEVLQHEPEFNMELLEAAIQRPGVMRLLN